MENSVDFNENEEMMNFEEYCDLVLDVPDTTRLSRREYNNCSVKYQQYLDRVSNSLDN
jgi:hypothetical protein